LRVVIALGGNALVRREEPPEAGVMQRNIAAVAPSLAEIAAHHEVIFTHGNGPQIGLLALQAEAYSKVPPYPLDVLGAESEGMIGYLVEREIANHLSGREICGLLTRVAVDPQDPAFDAPDKPGRCIAPAAEGPGDPSHSPAGRAGGHRRLRRRRRDSGRAR
jgi:carbamate kinase